MKLILATHTSLEFWRRIYPSNRTPLNPVAIPEDEVARSKHEVLSLAPRWLTPDFLNQTDGLLHAMVFSHEGRRKSDRHITHTWSKRIPKAPLFNLGDDTFVMSPEFTFLSAATLLEPIPLIALGDELCGLYSFDAASARGFRERKVPPHEQAQDCRFRTKIPRMPGLQARFELPAPHRRLLRFPNGNI